MFSDLVETKPFLVVSTSGVHSWLFLMQNVPRPQTFAGILVKSMFVLSENGVCFKMRNPINPSEQKAKNFILRNLNWVSRNFRVDTNQYVESRPFNFSASRNFTQQRHERSFLTTAILLGDIYSVIIHVCHVPWSPIYDGLRKMLRGEKNRILLIVFWSPGGDFRSTMQIHLDFLFLFVEAVWMNNLLEDKNCFTLPDFDIRIDLENFYQFPMMWTKFCFKAKGKELTSIYDFFIGLGHHWEGGKQIGKCVDALKMWLPFIMFFGCYTALKVPKTTHFL